MKRTKIIDHELVTMMPSDARRLLERNTDRNRNIKKSNLNAIVNDMVNGNFLSENGQTIVIGTDRKLYDGQHRLTAQVMANVPMKWLVVTVDDGETAYKTIDSGSRRIVADYFSKSEKNATIFASVASFAYLVEEGVPLTSAVRGVEGRSRPARHAVVAYGEKNSWEIEKATSRAIKMYMGLGKIGKQSVFGKFAWLISYIGEEDVLEVFIDDFCEMSPSSKTVVALKMTIMKNFARGESKRPDDKWMFGTLLDGYVHFKEMDDTTMLNRGWSRLEKYSKLLDAIREERR